VLESVLTAGSSSNLVTSSNNDGYEYASELIRAPAGLVTVYWPKMASVVEFEFEKGESPKYFPIPSRLATRVTYMRLRIGLSWKLDDIDSKLDQFVPIHTVY
jgi:hypothetical protein